MIDAYSVSGRYDGLSLGEVCETNYSEIKVKNFSDYENQEIDVFIHATRSFPEIVIPEIEKFLLVSTSLA